MQDSSVLLLTHAQVAVALAGFSGVTITIRRPLTALLRQRFLALMSLSFLQVLGSLLPVWLGEFYHTAFPIWRITASVMLALYLCHTIFLVLLPIKAVGRTIATVINPVVTVATWIPGLLSMAALILVAAKRESAQTFAIYYACHAAFLFTQFMIFADVATAKNERERLCRFTLRSYQYKGGHR